MVDFLVRLKRVPAMLIAPRRTIREIVDGEGPSWTLPLLALYGTAMSGLFFIEMNRKVDPERGLDLVLMVASIPALALLVMCFNFLGAVAFTLSGRLLGGVATHRELREAWAWSSLPGAMVGLLWIPFLGSELWYRSFPDSDDWRSIFGPDVLLLEAGLLVGLALVWGLLLRYAALIALHRFRLWRAVVSGLLGELLRLGVLGAAVGIGATAYSIIKGS